MRKISSAQSEPLHSVAATRELERQTAAGLPPHTLMQRAGLSVARLAVALAPHAQRIWIACGPGNNGGDGFEAAMHLHQWGRNVTVTVTWTGLPAGKTSLPPDAQTSRERALAAGVPMAAEPPRDFDFCIDALLGIGGRLDGGREGTALMRNWLTRMQASGAPRLAVDVPTGLEADTGAFAMAAENTTTTTTDFATKLIANSQDRIWAGGTFTLSLLTLKPGLFTAHGRDCAGQVWFDDLGADSGPSASCTPDAWLLGADQATQPARQANAHASHKGTFGDVAVLGGESTAHSHMAGAALLAARAALHAGAGRVFVALLGSPAVAVDPQQPELMFRAPEALDLAQQVVVCGCGGGDAVRAVLPKVLSAAPKLVLDADALNAIAGDTQLQTQLTTRHRRGYSTVLTPHPLEAARLAGTSSKEVQADRLTAARQLAGRFQCVVVLKGSGTVIAAPGRPSAINSTG
ncbi:MAG: bifunctional ADP-dependent NAD(P)H-hydrate dehydratase/NAD(P)H-hydrate epimerase, partial [Polaromonas sp.]|nr:bifunctional ADP-dependent NAD(P)H-hydrate dehydratase/NAD(P)H-hydrate epimerase [Polaromonas sp.]